MNYITAFFGCAVCIIAVGVAMTSELPNDDGTMLLLRFNNSLTGASGETPTASTGVSYIDGLIGQSAHTGNPGYIRYSTTDNILPSQGTVEFWIRPDWNGNLSVTHVFFQAGNSFNNAMLLSIDGGNNLRFLQWGDNPDTPEIETNVERGFGPHSAKDWVAGNWYHIAAAWNGSTREMWFFINGKQVNYRNDGVVIPAFSTTYLSIGANVNTSTPAEAGFDEFRIYNRARTSGEILDDYNAGLGISVLNNPYGACLDSTNRLIIAETGMHRVSVFDTDGAKLFSFGGYGSGLGEMNSPRDVAVDGNDIIYVADTENNRIQTFDSSGNVINQYGSYGIEAGNFNSPNGIYVDKTNGKIYVADTNNHRVQRFNDDFSIDATWSDDGVVGATGEVRRDHTGFDRPTNVAVNPVNGRVYVADYGNHRLEVFTSAGAYQRTFLAVYRPNAMEFDDEGNLYIAGEDPNTSYTYYDGRLRFLKAGEELISKHYSGFIDDLSRIQGGVALRDDGAIFISDTLNNRMVRTDIEFTKPITDLSIDAKGQNVTFRWKTAEPCSSSVRYGPTNSYGTIVTDTTITTEHEVTVAGLTPNTRLYYGVSFADSFDGSKRWTPQDILNTGALPGETQFLRLKAAGLIYLDKDTGDTYNPMTPAELDAARERYSKISKFYWINSGFRLWLDYTIIECSRNITGGSIYLWSIMQSDLSALGYSAADDFDAVHAASYCFNGNFGGGGNLFGRSIGASQWVTQGDFVPIHEVNHSIDSIYSANELKKYEFNHGIWAVPNGLGQNFGINGQILRNMLSVNYTATKSPYTKIMTAPDNDDDGFPDTSPAGLTNPLSVTEATFGSSTLTADSDGDGVTDLKEAMALIYHGTDPNSADSDGDGVPDNIDLNPAYPIRDHIAKATAYINNDNVFGARWTIVSTNWGYSNDFLVSDNNLYQGQTTLYAAWDDDYLYLGLKGPSTTATVNIDGSADNWYMGPDSYSLTLKNGTYSKAVKINVGVPDIFRQIDDDGQWSEIFDTNSMFTYPYQGRTTYNNPGDGLGFPGRLVTEDDLIYGQGGSGQSYAWKIAIPWSNKTLLKGYDGKEIAVYFSLSGDVIFETDHYAKLKLVEIGPPTITGISYSGSAATITFDCTQGVPYNIYYSDSIDESWTLIQQIVGQGNGTVFVDDGSMTDPYPISATKRFYRIGM